MALQHHLHWLSPQQSDKLCRSDPNKTETLAMASRASASSLVLKHDDSTSDQCRFHQLSDFAACLSPSSRLSSSSWALFPEACDAFAVRGVGQNLAPGNAHVYCYKHQQTPWLSKGTLLTQRPKNESPAIPLAQH